MIVPAGSVVLTGLVNCATARHELLHPVPRNQPVARRAVRLAAVGIPGLRRAHPLVADLPARTRMVHIAAEIRARVDSVELAAGSQ